MRYLGAIRPRPARRTVLAVAAVAASLTMVAGACGSSSSSSGSSNTTAAPSSGGSSSNTTTAPASTGKPVSVALILKEFTNPYFIFMEKAAKAEAAKIGVTLHVTAGNSDSDTTDQTNQIEDAVTAGDKGIIITTDGDAVNSALDQARHAGLLVVALDTAPIPTSTADITFATNNFTAGTLIGKWAGVKLGGQSADIALLDLATTEVLSVDVDRDHGFLTGMGIPLGDASVNGKEPTSGHYTGGKGGSYKIACQLPTGGSTTGGQSAMETCLSKDPNINLVYAINEPSAEGAAKALQAANKKNVTVVAIDGGCANLPFVKSGEIGATAGQFPGKMAMLGVDAIATLARTGKKPTTTAGLDFYDTGTELYTDSPQAGVASITAAAAQSICWG